MQSVSPEVSSVTTLFGREKAPKVGGNGSKNKKMSPLSVVVAILIVLLLLSATARNVMSSASKAPDTVTVVGAGQDILPGTRISFKDLHYVVLPKDYYSESMFARNNLVVGRIARSYIAKGEPLMDTDIFSGKDNISQRVETHERAMTLKLEDDALVDHSIASGDKVDVLFTATSEGKKYTKTVCQAVPVLFSLPREAMKNTAYRGQEANRITLAVTPEQAEILAQAQETGKLRLLLRNRLTAVDAKLGGVSEADLLPAKAFEKASKAELAAVARPAEEGYVPPPLPVSSLPAIVEPNVNPIAADNGNFGLPAVQKAAGWVVEVFSGNKRDTYEFPQTNAK